MRRIAFVLLAACGAGPDKPMLANVPHPNNAAVAGGAAAAAAAITLASPDAATAKPEKNQGAEKKPVTVKENVPKAVLDRLDKEPVQADAKADAKAKPEPTKKGAKQQPGGPQNGDDRPAKDALDFSRP